MVLAPAFEEAARRLGPDSIENRMAAQECSSDAPMSERESKRMTLVGRNEPPNRPLHSLNAGLWRGQKSHQCPRVSLPLIFVVVIEDNVYMGDNVRDHFDTVRNL